MRLADGGLWAGQFSSPPFPTVTPLFRCSAALVLMAKESNKDDGITLVFGSLDQLF